MCEALVSHLQSMRIEPLSQYLMFIIKDNYNSMYLFQILNYYN